MTWLIEDLGDGAAQRMIAAVQRAGSTAVTWQDSWWDDQRLPSWVGSSVLFHGSLGNAARIAARGDWRPGAFCNVSDMSYSRWAAAIRDDLVSQDWVRTTVRDLAAAPQKVADAFGRGSQLFVRPDSPLKPFAGRVLSVDEISLDALDYGFYYDDFALPVIVAPAVDVGAEWRFVVVGGVVVAASGYVADGRHALAGTVPRTAMERANVVAARLEVADPVYVLDLAETINGMGVVELNPFSGADLYDCDRAAVVEAVERCLMSTLG